MRIWGCATVLQVWEQDSAQLLNAIEQLLMQLSMRAAEGALVIEGDEDVAGAGWCIDGAYQKVQKSAIAVPDAMNWPVIWHQIALPCLSKCVHACGKPLHARTIGISPVSKCRPTEMWLLV